MVEWPPHHRRRPSYPSPARSYCHSGRRADDGPKPCYGPWTCRNAYGGPGARARRQELKRLLAPEHRQWHGRRAEPGAKARDEDTLG